MSKKNKTPSNSGQRYRTAAERFDYYEHVFKAVIEEYVRIKSLSPVVASVFCPDRIGQSYRLSYDSINMSTDIEHATTKALEHLPQLQAVWFALALGEAADPNLSRETIMRCGRIYTARKIAPWHYHASNRYPHRSTV